MSDWIVMITLSEAPDREWYLRKAGKGLSLTPAPDEAKRHPTAEDARLTLGLVDSFPNACGRIEQLPSAP